jgi:hypothetical protein
MNKFFYNIMFLTICAQSFNNYSSDKKSNPNPPQSRTVAHIIPPAILRTPPIPEENRIATNSIDESPRRKKPRVDTEPTTRENALLIVATEDINELIFTAKALERLAVCYFCQHFDKLMQGKREVLLLKTVKAQANPEENKVNISINGKFVDNAETYLGDISLKNEILRAYYKANRTSLMNPNSIQKSPHVVTNLLSVRDLLEQL